MKKIGKLFFILTLIFVLISCKTNKEIVHKKVPDWIENRPDNPEYYIGIGIASKDVNSDFRSVAKKNAFNDLVSEIEVEVGANSILYSLEQSNKFREDFLSATKLKSELSISDYEFYGDYQTKDNYYMMYRLSKSEYKRAKQEKIQQAIEAIRNNLRLSKSLIERGETGNALIGLINAVKQVEPISTQSVQMTVNQNKEYISNVLIDQFNRFISNIDYSIEGNVIQVNPFSSINTKIEIKNGVYVAGSLPFILNINDEEIKVKSDVSGKLIIPKSSGINNVSIVQIRLDINKLIKQAGFENDQFVSSVMQLITIPRINFSVEKEAIAGFVISNELLFNKSTNMDILASTIRKVLIENGFEIVDREQDATHIILINSNTSKGSKTYDLFTAFLLGTIEIKNHENKVVYSYSINSIKGVQLDYKSAGMNAYERATELISEEFLNNL